MSIGSVFVKILAPVFTIFFLMLGNGFFLSFVSLHLDHLGHSEGVIGSIHALYYAGLLIGAWRADHHILKVGHIRAYAAFCAIGTACFLVQALTFDIWVWGLTRFIMGFCVAVYYVVVESWFLSEASDQTRGSILSVYMAVLYLSQAASQYLLPYLDLSSAQPYLYAAILSILSQVPLTLTSAPAPHIHEGSRRTLTSLLRRSPFGFAGCVLAGVILSAIYSFVPLFATAVHLSVPGLVSTCILGGVILQWPLGHLSDIIDRRLVLLGVSVGTALPALAIVYGYPSVQLTYLLIFLLGGFAFTLYPLSITQVCDRLQANDITKATGVLLLAYGIGAVVGPILAPVCIHSFQPGGLFIFITGVTALLSIVGVWTIYFKPPIPLEDQADYVPLPPAATPFAYDLDPRAPEMDSSPEGSS